MMPWKSFVARAAVASAMLGVAVFAGVKLATAGPGVAGGPTVDTLTFAGVLRTATGGAPFAGRTTLTFVFRKGAGTPPPVACRSSVDVTIATGANGAFSVLVPIGPVPMRSDCTPALFDGADVTYDIEQTGEAEPIARNMLITPVPHARFADQAGVNNDCPASYTKSMAAADASHTVCIRRRPDGSTYDEVVKVGAGASAFWIDRYEASVWQNADGSGTRYGVSSPAPPNFPLSFPRNGQWTRKLYALSIVGVRPSGGVTWFQANEACRASGKRLPTSDEWLAAAHGTVDPGVTTGDDGACRTSFPDMRPELASFRDTGVGSRLCVSSWGAQDMIGNARELTNEWFATLSAESRDTFGPWDATDFYQDRLDHITSTAYLDGWARSPGAVTRGGGPTQGNGSGIFAVEVGSSPGGTNWDIGFRCVVPR